MTAPHTVPAHGVFALAKSNHNHSLAPVAAPHITFCAKLPLVAAHVKP